MKTDHEIEQLLEKGKTYSLSTPDKNAIKKVLLHHANTSLQYEPKKASLSWTTWFVRGSVSFAALLIIFGGTSYASQDSLPGEPLYGMKVHVVEEVIALTKTETSERMTYDLSLMETRLSELQALGRQTEILSAKDLKVISGQIEEHTIHLTDTLEITETTEISHEEKIELLSKLSGITQAQAAVAGDVQDLISITETILDIQEETDDSLTEAVQDFVSEHEVEMVQQYLSDQITDVSEQITTSTIDETTSDFVEYQLTEANDALEDSAITEAIISVLEAQQSIETDRYMADNNDILETNSASNQN